MAVSSASVERKLTTVLSADVDGYSRLMGEDEDATLGTLREYRRIFTDLIERHRGRVVSTAGDGLLAEFQSALEAVQCAVETQRELAARNETLPPGRRMAFRIGINLGDVMVDGADLFGEGVNVAARLQTLAPAGGVCLSGAVHAVVRSRLTVGFDYLGPQSVKNIDTPLDVWRVQIGEPPPRPAAPAPAPTPAPAPASAAVASGAAWHGHGLFGTHHLIAGVVILGLAAVDELSNGERWFQWPALGILLALVWVSLRNWGRAAGDETSPAGRRRRFWAQVGGLVTVLAGLFAVNLLSSPDDWWVQWPAIGIAAATALLAIREHRNGTFARSG